LKLKEFTLIRRAIGDFQDLTSEQLPFLFSRLIQDILAQHETPNPFDNCAFCEPRREKAKAMTNRGMATTKLTKSLPLNAAATRVLSR
jgi:hypothetical protein